MAPVAVMVLLATMLAPCYGVPANGNWVGSQRCNVPLSQRAGDSAQCRVRGSKGEAGDEYERGAWQCVPRGGRQAQGWAGDSVEWMATNGAWIRAGGVHGSGLEGRLELPVASLVALPRKQVQCFLGRPDFDFLHSSRPAQEARAVEERRLPRRRELWRRGDCPGGESCGGDCPGSTP
ncbi:unnamed protein product [Closterium sp. NIES-65]|nr:unnamed protein product [Closterium sp. NIES-65]CAI6002707.1 unnamed protein product [Closterium sp. NIES-65]